jgi:penicillin amidase
LEVLSTWDGRCSENSEAYYWIRSFRGLVAKRVLSRLLQPCLESCKSFDFITLDFEEPLWMVVSQKPAYLASSAYDSWDDELNAYIDDLIGGIPENRQLTEMRWGQHNTLQINHPLSGAFIFSDRLLNMAHDQVSGDFWVPRVAGPYVGASQRMVVSPGKEEEAIFHSPGGQSGHPLSPHYADGHQAWLRGLPESLLPGKKVTTLKLMPRG